MTIARKFITLPLSLGICVSLPSLSNAEVLKVDHIVLDVPDGGMTPSGPPASASIFKHRLFDLTVTSEVAGANSYESWEGRCVPRTRDADAATAFQAGTLARTDQYLYSKISKFSKDGIATPRGAWLEHCLVFRSGELAAKVIVDLPKSALERGDITAAEIEKILSKARLVAASVADRGTSDPRLVFEMPDDFVPAGLPTFTFRFNHSRLPFGINITLSDPKSYETAKMLNVHSARRWQVGSLARTDEYFYYFVWPDPRPDFELGFRAPDITAQVHVNVSKASLDNGDIGIPEIECLLASARVIPAAEPDKK
jgi:hypothetical protein